MCYPFSTLKEIVFTLLSCNSRLYNFLDNSDNCIAENYYSVQICQSLILFFSIFSSGLQLSPFQQLRGALSFCVDRGVSFESSCFLSEFENLVEFFICQLQRLFKNCFLSIASGFFFNLNNKSKVNSLRNGFFLS